MIRIQKRKPIIDQHDKSYLYAGKFGGNFVPETLKKPIDDLTKIFNKLRKDKKKFFTKEIAIKNIRKGDLLFWKGHVAIALSNKKLVHAFGPRKKVVIMGIKETVKKIYSKSKLPLLCVKRIKKL